MSGEFRPLPDALVAAYRAALGIVDGLMPDIAALEALDSLLDILAGPYRLTDGERKIRRACRERFGLYDPCGRVQARFVTELRLAQLLEAAA
jgi:hypothetical protein